jgi:hypothetical protein
VAAVVRKNYARSDVDGITVIRGTTTATTVTTTEKVKKTTIVTTTKDTEELKSPLTTASTLAQPPSTLSTPSPSVDTPSATSLPPSTATTATTPAGPEVVHVSGAPTTFTTLTESIAFVVAYVTSHEDVCLVSTLKMGNARYGEDVHPLDSGAGVANVVLGFSVELDTSKAYSLIVFTAPCVAAVVRKNYARSDVDGITVIRGTTTATTVTTTEKVKKTTSMASSTASSGPETITSSTVNSAFDAVLASTTREQLWSRAFAMRTAMLATIAVSM